MKDLDRLLLQWLRYETLTFNDPENVNSILTRTLIECREKRETASDANTALKKSQQKEKQ